MDNLELVTSRYGETTVSEFVRLYEADLEDSLAGAEMEFADGTISPLSDADKTIIYKITQRRFTNKIDVMRFALACRAKLGAATVAEVVDLNSKLDAPTFLKLIEAAPVITKVGGTYYK